jgi:hypothetical protein
MTTGHSRPKCIASPQWCLGTRARNDAARSELHRAIDVAPLAGCHVLRVQGGEDTRGVRPRRRTRCNATCARTVAEPEPSAEIAAAQSILCCQDPLFESLWSLSVVSVCAAESARERTASAFLFAMVLLSLMLAQRLSPIAHGYWNHFRRGRRRGVTDARGRRGCDAGKMVEIAGGATLGDDGKRTVTDANGRFAFQQLSGGSYRNASRADIPPY